MATEVHGPGAICETCGHFAARHNEDARDGAPMLGEQVVYVVKDDAAGR